MKKIGIIIALIVLITLTGLVWADRNVPATPEIQGIATGTGMNVQGTATETDSAAWTTTYDPSSPDLNTFNSQITGNLPGAYIQASPTDFQQAINNLQAQGGSLSTSYSSGNDHLVTQVVIPSTLLNQPGPFGYASWELFGQYIVDYGSSAIPIVTLGSKGGLHTGILDPGQVQYTTGYNDQYSGISGQQTFAKSMAVSTANKIADQSNIKANTNIQFIAIDTGRATRTEDLLLDGAANTTATSTAILCPFATATSEVIPPYCNIVQAGSAFDTTLTSTVTSADTRFVGADSTFPVVLNYNINAQGITLGSQSSPMIGSASAFLKVHIQESRDNTTTKSEDLVYSETSSASGLISKFSKSMSYQSGFNLI